MPRRRRYRPIDPLAPLSEKQIRRRALQDVALGQKPLADLINKRATAGAQNIQGIYSNLASSLGGYQGAQRDIYGRAQQALQGYGQAEQQAIGAAGGAIGSDLQKALALSGNAPANFGAVTAGVQAGESVRGNAQLGELALRQAAAENYAAQLPGIAKLSGAQGVQALQAERLRDIAELTARSKASLTDVLNQYRSRERDKAIARLGYQGDILGIQAQNDRALMAERGRNTRSAASIRVRNAAITAANKRAGMSLEERARHNGITERQQAARDVEARRKNRATERQARINQRNAERERRRVERQRKWKRQHPGADGGGSGY